MLFTGYFNTMKFLTAISSLLMVASGLVQAQLQGRGTSKFTDTATGIDFQAWEHPDNKLKFGLALPKSENNSELIRYLVRNLIYLSSKSYQGQVKEKLLINNDRIVWS